VIVHRRVGRKPRAFVLGLLLGAVLALAVPAWAAAATFTVDDTGDGARSESAAAGECVTAGGRCTLRAAIEAANESSVGSDVIGFDPAVFNGEPTDTIAPALLDEIVTPTTIDGANCNPGSAVACISGANVNGFTLIAVKADESTVEKLKVDIPAGVVGIRALGTGAAKPGVAILDNTVALTGTTLPSTGIYAIGTIGGTGNLIEGNTILATSGFNFNSPIVLRNGPNRVLGNEIKGSGCCYGGITMDLGAAGNQIGGDTEASENVIENFEAGAIRMEANSSHNEVRRNRGSGGSNFINGGTTPVPTIATGFRSNVAGTAEAGATVRVFRSEFPGEIGGFLGEAVADGSGDWEVTFPQVSTGTTVAATQTLAGSTSSLSPAAATITSPEEEAAEKAQQEKEARERQEREAREGREKAAEEQREREAGEQREKEGGSAGSGGGDPGGTSTGTGSSSPTPPATTLPTPGKATVRITATVKITAGPRKTSTATTAKFKFKATPAAGAKLECKLDGAKWATCKSPKAYKKLKPGKHTFRTRAVASGLKGPVTKSQFTVKP